MEELIKRLERVIQTGAPDKDGQHPISAETVLEVVNGLSGHGTNLAEVGTGCSEFPNNSDAISRQAAIDALNEEYHGMISDESMKIYKIIEWLGELPSAQPEVIRCKDCKHWKDSDGVFRRGIGVESKCPLNLHQVYEGTFYCGLGERREVQDENDKTTNNTTNA